MFGRSTRSGEAVGRWCGLCPGRLCACLQVAIAISCRQTSPDLMSSGASRSGACVKRKTNFIFLSYIYTPYMQALHVCRYAVVLWW